MKHSLPFPRSTMSTERWLDAAARSLVHRSLSRLSRGVLTIEENGERFELGKPSDLSATVNIVDPECYRAIAFGGTIGAGTSYMDGQWTTNDLPSVIRLFLVNREALFGLEDGLARLMRPVNTVFQFLRRNTRRGSRRNIAEHYDLGNDFYRLFLDESMAYSCGVFEREGDSMHRASLAKFDRIARKLRLSPRDHVLEIGTGWGGFAIYAAAELGCRVTSTTISREQYELATERVAEAGVSDRVRILFRDYRDLDGTYDKLVSIEMIEAVGYRFYDSFFSACSRLLEPDGMMLLQAITIDDQEFDRHRREVDFIKRYIFPGSCIPSVTALLQSATRASDLRLYDLEDITPHYVTTLRKWREAFWANVDRVRSQKFPERFIRMWDFYLGYCEGGFAERYLGDVQMMLVKPGFRSASTSACELSST